MSVLQGSKIVLMELTHLSKDALHVYVGLGVMLIVATALKRSLADWRPLAVVALAAVAGEAWDVIDTFRTGGQPKWNANIKDVWNTMFWPTILFGLARFTRVLKR